MALPHIPLLQPLGAGAHGSTQDLVGRGQEAPPGFVFSPSVFWAKQKPLEAHQVVCGNGVRCFRGA